MKTKNDFFVVGGLYKWAENNPYGPSVYVVLNDVGWPDNIKCMDKIKLGDVFLVLEIIEISQRFKSDYVKLKILFNNKVVLLDFFCHNIHIQKLK